MSSYSVLTPFRNENFSLFCRDGREVSRAFQVLLVVKNLPANAGGLRDVGLIPRLGSPLEESMATHSSVLACRIPWTEEPGELQSMVSTKSWT